MNWGALDFALGWISWNGGRRSQRRPAAGDSCLLWLSALSGEVHVCCDRLKCVCACVNGDRLAREEGRHHRSLELYVSSSIVGVLLEVSHSVSELVKWIHIISTESFLLPLSINSGMKSVQVISSGFIIPWNYFDLGLQTPLFAHFNSQKIENIHTEKLKWLWVLMRLIIRS